jgi:hypothetical protein
MTTLRVATVLCAVATFAGCGSWKHPERTGPDFYSDKMACEERAVGLYPVQIVQRQLTGGYYQPAQAGCSSSSKHVSCSTSPGTYVHPTYATEDVNAGTRKRSVSDCLRATGWTWK